jgi:hypothetical protein
MMALARTTPLSSARTRLQVKGTIVGEPSDQRSRRNAPFFFPFDAIPLAEIALFLPERPALDFD